MCLIESPVDDDLVFSVFRSEDSLEDRFAICFANFRTSKPISSLTAWIWFLQENFTSFAWFLDFCSKSFNSIVHPLISMELGNMTFNLLVKVALFFDEGLERFITVIVITCWVQIQHWFSNLSTSTVRRYFDQSILTFSSFFDNIPKLSLHTDPFVSLALVKSLWRNRS